MAAFYQEDEEAVAVPGGASPDTPARTSSRPAVAKMVNPADEVAVAAFHQEVKKPSPFQRSRNGRRSRMRPIKRPGDAARTLVAAGTVR